MLIKLKKPKENKSKFVGITIIVLLLVMSLGNVISADELGKSNKHDLIIPNNYESISLNYSQMALDFVEEYYPEKTLKIISNSTDMPHRETGYLYEYFHIDLIPGDISPEDSVVVTIRHDTLKIEFGHGQYITDYEEYLDSMPPEYIKMSSELRELITSKVGNYKQTNLKSSNVEVEVIFEVLENKDTHFLKKIRKLGITNYEKLKFSPQNYSCIKVSLFLSELVKLSSLPIVETVNTNHMVKMETFLEHSAPFIGAAEL